MNTKDINAVGCATRLCTEMMFLKGKQNADQSQIEDAENRDTFDLQVAVDFTAEFFIPLMTHKAA